MSPKIKKPNVLSITKPEDSIEPNNEPKPQTEDMSEILPFLYLGNEKSAMNVKELKKNNIGYILNVSSDDTKNDHGLIYKHISIKDNVEEDIMKYFVEAFKFIEKAKSENSKILVHCKEGKSRSATIVIAYLMKYKKETLMSYKNAYNYVQLKRNNIDANFGFMVCLEQYQKHLENENNKKICAIL